ncbi:MAG: N-acetyl-alpha-D-glucosaminyl L-malate synthase BshA [marine benthic group bacterium]|jgi:N-acetyl-alpha-D-glucosaminyl L-malate synthase BshA|nr:N-acetyl-alpha-D-glucosaminyl L-malate synthase BshA [Gemmatimonadota bacterium]MCL7962235.1 N-acetyl-alpha-D-glucosaminyl L-malate synthase BshA [Candidatus Carthagonibacter metallireducens]MCL7970255.1 N-acetyl-alpha-D-glucosaminyl L-malate synthase BshA [Gemmatimonadota bacterium]MCL7980247.1 N-acetyl-alpha-D-glucosaminyl L-malate synthase BshA [Gemmatimonadota bacterium]MCL7982999.1 N-acetyl-alpha-D-glucosaminyl L-malate synthase BshA [Gemmatimonadota bacterium]
MRIGIACYPTYGGSGAVATELGLQLAERGHEVHFISYAQPFRLTTFRDRVYFHEVEVPHYPLFEYPPYSLALAVQVGEVARQHDLELLHAHYAIPHAAAAWMAEQMLLDEGHELKIVTTLHGTDITLVGQDPSFWSITRFSVERSDGVTAVSEYLRDETYRAFQCRRADIRVIPNFIDPDVFDRTKYECHGDALAPGGEKIVMHISNFRPVKRVGDVVAVFAGIRDTVSARLVFVGDGPERAHAWEEVTRRGLQDDVVFLGKLESVAELLSCADLFLLPSEMESFGLVALEAMASGVPVIGASGSGLNEVVEDGQTGYLHPVGDVAAMSASGTRLLTDTDLWNRMSEAARQRAVERFHVDRVIPMYEAFYAEVLGS